MYLIMLLEHILELTVDCKNIHVIKFFPLSDEIETMKVQLREISENTYTHSLLGIEKEEAARNEERKITRSVARRAFLGDDEHEAYECTERINSRVMQMQEIKTKGTILFFLNCSITNVKDFVDIYIESSHLNVKRLQVCRIQSKWSCEKDGSIEISREEWNEKKEHGELCVLYENMYMSWGYDMKNTLSELQNGTSFVCIGSIDEYQKMQEKLSGNLLLFLLIPEKIERLVVETQTRDYSVINARQRFESLRNHIDFLSENDGYVVRWQADQSEGITSYYIGMIDAVISMNPLMKQPNIEFLREYRTMLQNLVRCD